MARTARYDRQTALDKAVVLFWQRGYHGASMKQIEHALDMRPGSIYATFGSKDGLFREALLTYAKSGGQALANHLAGYTSVVEGLQDYLRTIAGACTSDGSLPSRACMIIKTLLELSNTNESLAEQANGLLNSVEHTLTDILEQARANGELRSGTDCARLARLFQAQIIGLRSFAQRDTHAQHVIDLSNDMAAILDNYRAMH